MIMSIVIFYSGSVALCSCVVTLRAMKPYIPVPVVAFGREVKLQINSHIENHRLVRARVRLFSQEFLSINLFLLGADGDDHHNLDLLAGLHQVQENESF